MRGRKERGGDGERERAKKERCGLFKDALNTSLTRKQS